MKEHDSRRANANHIIKWLDDKSREVDAFETVYLDSNNFLHRIDGPSWMYISLREYWIHGKRYKNKRDWGLEVNRIKTLKEI